MVSPLTDRDDHRAIVIPLLIERSIAAYQRARAERAKLHHQAWEKYTGPHDPDVLAEAEVRSSSIAGWATSFAKGRSLDSQQVDGLRRTRIFTDPTIAAWVAEQGSSFPDFVDYLGTVEALRYVVLEMIEDRLGEPSPHP